MGQISFFDDETMRAALPYRRAVEVIERALREGLDPEGDGERLFAPAPDGEFLIMPAQGSRFSGVKVLTIAPHNPARGLERIQGVYLLYASDTLAPVGVFDGSTLTAIRTPAVTACAISNLLHATAPGQSAPAEPRILLIGAGVQASGCVQTLRSVLPAASFEVAGRSVQRVQALRSHARSIGVDIADRSSDLDTAVSKADVIVCATTSSTPLFAGTLPKPDAIVAAIGSHGLMMREVDDAFVARADVVVEGRASAARENGNLASLTRHGSWDSRAPANLQDLVTGRFTRTAGRPAFYTGVGMSWEDLVCAAAIYAAA